MNTSREGISARSSLSWADVKGVIAALTKMIPELLKNGYTFDLERLRIFSRAETGMKNIRGVQVNFRPSVRLKNEITRAKN